MRLPNPSPVQFLGGLGLVMFAVLIAIGSGFEVDIEHDATRLKTLALSSIMVAAGLFLLWLSLRRPPGVPR